MANQRNDQGRKIEAAIDKDSSKVISGGSISGTAADTRKIESKG